MIFLYHFVCFSALLAGTYAFLMFQLKTSALSGMDPWILPPHRVARLRVYVSISLNRLSSLKTHVLLIETPVLISTKLCIEWANVCWMGGEKNWMSVQADNTVALVQQNVHWSLDSHSRMQSRNICSQDHRKDSCIRFRISSSLVWRNWSPEKERNLPKLIQY